MAEGLVTTQMSKERYNQYNGRMTKIVILSCMMAAMGGLLFGYDIGISGGVSSMEPFLEKFFPKVYKRMKEDRNISNYCKYDSQLLTAYTSTLYIAGFMASFFASSTTRSYGRKPSILVSGFTYLVGVILGAVSTNIYMLIFGRVLLGVGVGFANQAVPLYLSEMAPAKYRGRINNGFQLCISLGVLYATLVNFGTENIKVAFGWRISLAMAVIPASFLTIGCIFLPETPNSLIQRGNDHQKVKLTLQKVRGTVDVQVELDDLINASSTSIGTFYNPLQLIMQKKYRPQLVMAITIPFFQQVTGVNVIGLYIPLIFRTIGLGESTSLLSAVLACLFSIGSTLMTMFIVDKVGRRFLFMVGGVIMFTSLLLVGGILTYKLGDHTELMAKGYAYLVLVLICVYAGGFGLSWGPLGWLVSSEIFPLEIRSIGQSITGAITFSLMFIISQAFLAMLCHLKAGIFFFFGGWVLVMTVFVYFFLPETKNIPMEQMDRIWMTHWFWKRIIGEETG